MNKTVSITIISGPVSVKHVAIIRVVPPVLLNCASHLEDVGGVKVKLLIFLIPTLV